MTQQKIHLHTAAPKATKAGFVRAEAGEDLIVGVEIDMGRALRLVESGGAIVVGGGTLDPLDHDGSGKRGGARRLPGATAAPVLVGSGVELPPIQSEA